MCIFLIQMPLVFTEIFRFQNDELLHSMIHVQFQAIIEKGRFLSVIQKAFQDLKCLVIIKV